MSIHMKGTFVGNNNTVQKEFVGFSVLRVPVCKLGMGFSNNVIQALVEYEFCTEKVEAYFKAFVA